VTHADRSPGGLPVPWIDRSFPPLVVYYLEAQRDVAIRPLTGPPCGPVSELGRLVSDTLPQPFRDGIGVQPSRSLAIELGEKGREVAVRPYIDEALPGLDVHDDTAARFDSKSAR
jgi:hypothetical protein